MTRCSSGAGSTALLEPKPLTCSRPGTASSLFPVTPHTASLNITHSLPAQCSVLTHIDIYSCHHEHHFWRFGNSARPSCLIDLMAALYFVGLPDFVMVTYLKQPGARRAKGENKHSFFPFYFRLIKLCYIKQMGHVVTCSCVFPQEIGSYLIWLV